MRKPVTLTVLEQPVPMHEQVYQQIVQALMAGYFDPGQKLTYRKVAEQFGVSPMPVRTAFQRCRPCERSRAFRAAAASKSRC